MAREDSGPEHMFAYARQMTDLPAPELVENWRRSVAMLTPGAPASNRDEALELLNKIRRGATTAPGLRQ